MALPTPACAESLNERELWLAIYDALYSLVNDTAGPQVVSATIDASGEVLTVVFDEAVTGGTGFSIDSTYGSSSATYNSGDGTSTLVFDLSRVIYSNEVPTLSYTAGDIEDLNGNPLQDFSGASVTNDSAQDFAPSDISGMDAWYQAYDAATITKDGSDRVSAWGDKSPGTRNITQATAANQPLWQAAQTPSGLAAIRFDGVSDRMQSASFLMTHPKTLAMRFRPLTWTLNADALCDNTGVNSMLIYNPGASPAWVVYSGSGGPSNSGATLNNWHTLIACWDGASSYLEIDGVVVTGAVTGFTGNAGFILGAGSGATRFGNFDCPEAILYAGALGSDDRVKLSDYLNGV